MKKSLLILALAIFAITAINMANAQTYDPYAVQVINNLIANNGLNATPNAPETWEFATWNNETPKKIIELMLTNKSMWGNLSFSGLATLKKLYCNWTHDNNGCIVGIDVSNCTQLEILNCASLGILGKLSLTNCYQLQTLNCFGNALRELNLTGFSQLKTLICTYNCLISLDLTELNNLVDFDGNGQRAFLTLFENQAGEFSHFILLNNPTFSNDVISYSNGVLKSTNKNELFSDFTTHTNKLGYYISGNIMFSYSFLGITSIDDEEINVYPNPTTGELRITNYELRIMSIELFDVYGKNAGKYNHSFNTEIIINISHLQPSTYFVKITTEQGEIVRKIVKQ